MMAKIRAVFTKPVRKYIYSVSLALTAALVAWGKLPGEAMAYVVPLALALLNLTPDEVDGYEQ